MARPGRGRGGLSLRARVLSAMGLVALVLLVAGVVVVRTTSTHLLDQVDAQLERASGPSFAPRPGTGDQQPPAGADILVPPSEQPTEQPSEATDDEESFNTLYVGFVDGATVRSLRVPNSLDDTGRPDVDIARIRVAAATGEPFTVDSTGGDERYRVVAHEDARTGALVLTGLLLTDVDGTTQRLVIVVVVTGAVLLAVLALISWWVLRLGVRPIKEMTGAAADIAAGDLSHRIPPAPAGTEAAELGDALNVMLGNIQAAFDERAASQERLRRFVGDASHELRTPVTTIRGYAELQRAGGLEDPEQLDAAMRRIEAESVRMGNLVGDLLQLARLDQGRRPRVEPVDLVPVLRDAAADFSTVHRDHELVLELPPGDGPVTVVGDPDLLHQVVANLLGNAGVHTPAGTTVQLRLLPGAGAVRVVVADDGPGMSAEDAARAFERFHRADPSRTRASGGSGLGLAIVQAVAEAHGGSVSLDAEPGRGTEVTIELPLAGAPAVPPSP
ncbi:sensor histidine kinase [Dermatobacter hominis]|uniref:sensor histidine kinase n=1 Tax=Dermatobacter hominis TaxID=2884263 RepID=UPI001D115124|nr:HAMP domain-containing sensor histidine kinase [Dermatobacter hominis]UDY35538.1 HAMP domain-containing histidine kinase [Dermatobacter hominis]